MRPPCPAMQRWEKNISADSPCSSANGLDDAVRPAARRVDGLDYFDGSLGPMGEWPGSWVRNSMG